MSTPIAFIDTETTHLSAEIGEVWEVAIILRESDGETEHVWQFAPRTIDPEIHGKALRIGCFHERFAIPDGCTAAYTAGGDIDPMTRDDAITEIAAMLKDAEIVASNAAFDDRHLRKLLGIHDEQPWHYRPLCVATYAYGYLRGIDAAWVADQKTPVSSRALSRRLGVEPPDNDHAHQALHDARWHRDMYDAINCGAK